MSLASLTSRQAVLDTLAEFDALGRDAFLAKYGYRPSLSYFLLHDGKRYDSKAIAGVAVGKQDSDHTLRSLIVALSVEAGELLELTLWKSDEEVAAFAAGERAEDLQNECADVLAYLLLIADRAGFDLLEATQRKIELNAIKYPVHKAKGSAKKYTEL